MANKYTTLSELFTAIADAIRSKKGTTEQIIADNFPMEIEGISTGVEVSGTKEITKNGVHDVTNYANANVNVPTPISDLVMPKCVYVAKGVITTTEASYLTLNGTYQYTAGANNRHALCVLTRQTYGRDNAVQVTLSGDSASGSTTYRNMRLGSNTVKGGSNTTQQCVGEVSAIYGGEPINVTIYLCDPTLYDSNPSAYPQLVDITQMVSSSTGTLVNKS